LAERLLSGLRSDRDAVSPEMRVPGRHYHGAEAVLLQLGKALIVMVGIGACRELRSEVYEIPPGFRGWAHIDVDMPECAPLDVRENVTYFRIAPNGRGCTSGVPASGPMKTTYIVLDKDRTPLRQTGWGGGGLIWAGHSIGLRERGGPGRDPKRYLCSFGFFVGTEEEFKRSGGDSPSNEKCSPREFDPARVSPT
jgi:hypothetical protein